MKTGIRFLTDMSMSITTIMSIIMSMTMLPAMHRTVRAAAAAARIRPQR